MSLLLTKSNTTQCVCLLAARKKLLDTARQAGLGGDKKTKVTKPSVREMWDGGKSKLTLFFYLITFSHLTCLRRLLIV